MEATQVFHTPVRLMPTTVSHSAGVTSSHGWIEQTPALATTMSSRPSGHPVGHGVGHAPRRRGRRPPR